MRKFLYKLNHSPYDNSIKARNLSDAWERLGEAYPEYKDIKKVVAYLMYA